MSKILIKFAVLCAAFACTIFAHAQSLTLNSESEVTITGRLMSPSGGWGWGLTRAGVITIRDGSGAVVAEKVWQSANSGGENYVARDYSVTTSTVSVPLALVTTLPAGGYTVSTTGSYSQGSWGYLWSEVASSTAPVETWTWESYSIAAAWSDWSPDPSTVPAGQSYTQSRSRSIEDRKKEVSSLGAERNDQHVALRSETESRGATGTMEIWVAFDEPESWQYGAWSPDPSTIDAGIGFTQSRTNTRYHRTGERSNAGNERNVGGYTETASESRAATGTRPIATAFSFGNLTHTYNGSPKAATVTASPSNATFTASLAAGPAAGTYTVSATANGNYTGSGSATLTIARANQSITFANPGGKTYGDAPFALSGSASSGLPVTFTLLSGPATISGSTVTLTGTGTVTVRASQGGNGNYNAATSVDQSFTVQPGAPAMLLNVAALAFGNVRVNTGSPTTSAITFRITNTGYGDLTVSAISFGNADYTVIGLNGGAVSFPRDIAPGGILDVTVMFNPSIIGSRNTTMTIANTSSNAAAVTTVTGTGLDPALVISWPGSARKIP